MALHHVIHTVGGVIDPDYTGVIRVILLNSGDTPYKVTRGDRIAQIVFERIMAPLFVEGKVLYNSFLRSKKCSRELALLHTCFVRSRSHPTELANDCDSVDAETHSLPNQLIWQRTSV